MSMPFERGPRCLILGIVVLTALVATGCRGPEGEGVPKASGKGDRKGGGGDVPVVVTKAVTRDVPVEVEVIGNVEASSMVMVKPQVSGELTKVLFKEGEFVKAGDPLFEIDRRGLEAQIQQAQANLARSEAQMRLAEANLARSRAQSEYTREQAGRYERLMKEGVISKEQNDAQQSTARAQNETVAADTASIESSRADIAANKALIQNLRVQIGFTAIKAPISGRTGTLLVKRGNIVQGNTTDLVQINQLQPAFVSFAIPENQLPLVARQFGKAKIPVIASRQDGADAEQGLLTFFENSVDATTGTIRLRATFTNEDRKLWPGEFVRVRMQLGSTADSVVVPNQAVQTGQDGAFVYVVKADQTAEMRSVVPGARTGMDVVIAKGLRPGETVVTEGQLRLAPGMKVRTGGPRGAGKQGKKKGSPPAEGSKQ